MIDGRHEHQEAAGHGDMRRQARALRAQRLLDDLDENLLSFADEIFDLRLRSIAVAVAVAPLVVVVGRQLVELLHRIDHIVDVEEAVALEPDVDEGGLHAGEDLRDPALVDVADNPALPLAFDEHFGHEVVFENGHHGLVAIGGDDHLLVHCHEPLSVASHQSSVASPSRRSQSPVAGPRRLTTGD